MVQRVRDSAIRFYRSWVPERAEGQGMAEYGLILAGVSILAIVALFFMGGKLGTMLNRVSGSLS